MFGAIGDGTTDDFVALQAWLDCGGNLALEDKAYRSSQTLILRKAAHVRGQTYGFDSGLIATGGTNADMPGARIIFDAGVGGFDIQPSTALTDYADVVAAGADAWTQEGAFNSILENFGVLGQGGATATGIYSRSYFHAKNVKVLSFSGKGWDLSASGDSGDGNSEFGNMSTSTLTDCSAEFCGSHGLHIRGRDANTIMVTNFNSRLNGGWGILNESVSGNTFIKPHLAGTTLGAIKVPGAAGSFFIAPYIEPDGGAATQYNGYCIIYSGDYSASNTTGNPSYYGSTITRINRLVCDKFLRPEAMPAETTEHLPLGRPVDARPRGLPRCNAREPGRDRGCLYSGSVDRFQCSRQSSTAALQVQGTSFGHFFQTIGTNQTFPSLASGYLAICSTAANGATIGGYGTSYDTSLFNRNRAFVFGVVANSVNVACRRHHQRWRQDRLFRRRRGDGHASDVENDWCNARQGGGRGKFERCALAANARAVFTLTNNKIGVDDRLDVWVKSGNATAATYRAWSEGNAAGSRTIVLENMSAGSLSEAIVLGFLIIKGAVA